MIDRLDGYDVTEAELQEYLAGLTMPAFDVEVIKRENIYEVYCNCKLLYYYESKVTADQEKRELKITGLSRRHRSILRIKRSCRQNRKHLSQLVMIWLY